MSEKDNAMFNEVMSLAFQKFVSKKVKHGNSWKTTNLRDMIDYLSQHWKKFKQNFRDNKILTILATKEGKNQAIDDLLDVINYCVMIVKKTKKEG